MADALSREPMLDLFVYEIGQLMAELEEIVLGYEKKQEMNIMVEQVFRIMHTIKGSASMMLFDHIAFLAHTVEDLFFYLREKKPVAVDTSGLVDLVLESADFIKMEIAKINGNRQPDGDISHLTRKIDTFITALNVEPYQPLPYQNSHQKYYLSADSSEKSSSRRYEALVWFDPECQMESLHAFAIIHQLTDLAQDIRHIPENITDNSQSDLIIQSEGLKIFFTSERTSDELRAFFEQMIAVRKFDLQPFFAESPWRRIRPSLPPAVKKEEEHPENGMNGKVISVNVAKLDYLMDLVGELVVCEAMIAQNPELEGLRHLQSFYRSTRQLHKITNELQDVVMSIRMVPLRIIFQKLKRLTRDLCRKLGKEVELVHTGEETEVDKNIIEHLTDPLIHLVRNAVDHAIEPVAERKEKGKPESGRIYIEAQHTGGEILIAVCDDGRGFDKEKILAKAWEKGLLARPEQELTDREIYAFVTMPGFSTREEVTELSGRGVGLDVVTKNIGQIGGTVNIDSVPGMGTTISLKIPLTMVIIDGMTLQVGDSRYTVPTSVIRESFVPREEELLTDPDGNEMVYRRGECYPVLKLFELYSVKTRVTRCTDGIMIMLQNNERSICLFADALLGGQQVVVKSLPLYIKKIKGIAGCALLGDGRISLILDTEALLMRDCFVRRAVKP